MKKENSFSTNLLLLLRKQKITQKKFAQMLNTKESVISHWLTGKTLPSSKSILKITDIFNVPAGYFFDEKAEIEQNKKIQNNDSDLILNLVEKYSELIEKIKNCEKENIVLKKEIEFLKSQLKLSNKKSK